MSYRFFHDIENKTVYRAPVEPDVVGSMPFRVELETARIRCLRLKGKFRAFS